MGVRFMRLELFLAAGVLLGESLAAAEFEVMDKLKVNGGVEISTSAAAPALIFASSTTSQGNVGIGTTAPVGRLNVSNTAYSNTNPTIRVQGAVDDAGVQFQSVSGTNYSIIKLNGTNTLNFQVDGVTAQAIVINTSGNVGIGTINPTGKLHVGGTSGTDGIKFPDGTLQTTAAAAKLSSHTYFNDQTGKADTTFASCNVSGSTVSLTVSGTTRIEVVLAGSVRLSDNASRCMMGIMINGQRVGNQSTTKGIWQTQSAAAGWHTSYNTIWSPPETFSGTVNACLAVWTTSGNCQPCSDTNATTCSLDLREAR